MAKTMEDLVKEQLGGMTMLLLQKEAALGQLIEKNQELEARVKELESKDA